MGIFATKPLKQHFAPTSRDPRQISVWGYDSNQRTILDWLLPGKDKGAIHSSSDVWHSERQRLQLKITDNIYALKSINWQRGGGRMFSMKRTMNNYRELASYSDGCIIHFDPSSFNIEVLKTVVHDTFSLFPILMIINKDDLTKKTGDLASIKEQLLVSIPQLSSCQWEICTSEESQFEEKLVWLARLIPFTPRHTYAVDYVALVDINGNPVPTKLTADDTIKPIVHTPLGDLNLVSVSASA